MKRMTIRLNFNNYPLYVGDTSDFPYRYGCGADIDIIAEVNSGVYTADNITWTVSNPEIVSLTVKDNATVTEQALRRLPLRCRTERASPAIFRLSTTIIGFRRQESF